MDIKLNPIFRETYTLGDVGVKEKGYTSRKPAWDATPARQYVRSGALRRRAVPDSSESLSPLRELL